MNYIKFLTLIFIISSCIDKEKTLDNGVLVKYFKNGSGNQIKDDEIMLFNLQYFDYEGTELFNRSGDQPVIIQKSQINNYFNLNNNAVEFLNNISPPKLKFYEISTDVNNPAKNDPSIINPIK